MCPESDARQSIDHLLHQGIQAARTGQKERARRLLMGVIERDEDNLPAWLWLSSVVKALDDRIVCLENVLAIDPAHAAARRGLDRLRKEQANQWLHQGIAAAREGREDQARDLLMRVVERDEGNPLAWLWLSSVVDGLQDQEIALENVLTLDPEHAEAREKLAQVRRQRERQVAAQELPHLSPPPSEQPEAAALEEPAATARRPDAAQAFGEEYLCPYCAAPTHPQDRRCPHCGGHMWIQSRQQEQSSPRFQMILLLQGACILLNGAGLVLLLTYIRLRVDTDSFSGLARAYLGLSSDVPQQVQQAALQIVPRPAMFTIALLFLLSLAVLVGLFLHWKPTFYLILVNAIGLAIAGVVITLLLWETTGWGNEITTTATRLTLIAIDMSLLAVVTGFVLELRADVFFEQKRVHLRLDGDVTSGPALLTRGREYLQRGMWAMAALHLDRAVQALPEEVDAHAALALAYIQLQKYDLAANSVEEVRLLRPDDPRVDDLSELLTRGSGPTQRDTEETL